MGCRGGCRRLDVTNFLDVLALACTNKISYRVQNYRSLELVVVELVYDPSFKVKISPNGTRATPRVPVLSTDS
jgi:hypothetical protein